MDLQVKRNVLSLANTRTRVIFLVVIGLLILGIVVGLFSVLSNTPSSLGTSMTTEVPKVSSQFKLGQDLTPEYAELSEKAHQQQLENAKKKGLSVIPELSGKPVAEESVPKKIPELPPELVKQSGTSAPISVPVTEHREISREPVSANDSAASPIQNTMKAQAQSLFSAWSAESPKMVVVQSSVAKESSGTGTREGQHQLSESSQNTGRGGKVLFKAGTILYAVLNTAVNSDEPGPVLATITAGELKGTKLLGSLQRVNKRVVLSFNLMTPPMFPDAIPIKAVAINPDTSRLGLASDVDSHYFLRYGTLIASSFLQGYGNAVSNAGTITEIGPLTLRLQKQNLSRKDQFISAMGSVGARFGQELSTIFNTPPTVEVYSGEGIGILFTESVRY